MTPNTLARRSVMTMVSSVLVALSSGDGRQATLIIRSETVLAESRLVHEGRAGLQSPPLAFERAGNVGFLARGGDYQLAVGEDGASLVLGGAGMAGDASEVRIHFVGSRRADRITGVVSQALGSGALGRSAPTGGNGAEAVVGRVRTTGIYDGVAIEYSAGDRRVAYDVIVEPGAEPGDLAIAFNGADMVSVDAAGDLIARVGRRTIRQRRPTAYQLTRDGRRPVEADYLLLGAGRIVVAIGDYDRGRPLVISPVIETSSEPAPADGDQVAARTAGAGKGSRA